MWGIHRSTKLMGFPIFTTWTLWHYLVYPPDHPVFKRKIKPLVGGFVNTWMALSVLFVSLLLSCGLWTMLPRTKPFIATMLMVLMGFASTTYVGGWMVRLSIAISQEHAHRTFDVLCLLPSGALGASWAICASHLHHSDILGWIGPFRKLFAGLFLFLLLMLLLTARPAGGDSGFTQSLRLLLDMMALGIVLYSDHVQSVVIGAMVGMLVPVYSRDRPDTGFWAAGTFLVAQAIPYLTALLILHLAVDFTPVALSLLVFSLLREILIVVLWRWLAFAMNGEVLDIA